MRELNADVVIVAAGPAGLAAAVTAAQGGASVIIFEKAPVTGGNAGPDVSAGMGFFAVESRLQRQKLVTLTLEDAFKIHMDYTHWRIDARLLRAYYEKSASTVDWLEKMGLEFDEPRPHNPTQNATHHQIKGPAPDPNDSRRRDPAGAMLGKVLTERALELGVEIHLRTPVRQLIKENDCIVGVIAENSSGEEIRAKAGAVIIATGGFGDNPEMMKKYTGYESGHDMFQLRVPGLTGDGIRMAWEAGAGHSDTIVSLNCTLPVGMHPLRHTPSVMMFCQPGLFVNLFGERFINEEVISLNPAFAGNAVYRQKGGCAFSIFDEATKRHYEDIGFHWRSERVTDGVDAALKQLKDNFTDYDKHLFVADSLEEFAGWAGINAAALRQTVDEYNRACEAGVDRLFDKNYRYLLSVKEPRFYAGRLAASGYSTLGGIKINHRTEVVTQDYDVIPGLYAAGSDANSLHGDTYVFSLPGNMIGFALNSGRMAGENALKYLGIDSGSIE
jgi:fumarate reductase flavoprotein subunit